ncbi:DAK2 domain-containing protein [bacterium LRH843]|nr:DAK2 domain-containing protein [bacterium LRH843]
MTVKQIEGKMLAKMFLFGASNLSQNVKIVDSLNVFPVPDGDTGTNMNLSISSGVKEFSQSKETDAGTIAGLFAKGLLMGARGNSGVILSQLFRGFSKHIEGKAEISAMDFADALHRGVETAYKAVMKPVEGTILTVAKDAANHAMKTAKRQDDLIIVMEETINEASASLKRTPDLLPVLKEVGVVDSGGQGLLFIYQGFLAAMKGDELPGSEEIVPQYTTQFTAELPHAQSYMSTEDIEFGYCTEVMVRFKDDKTVRNSFDRDTFSHALSKLGDSLLVVSDEDHLKVHIHAEKPGEVLTEAQQYGELIHIKIENMREQHTHLLEETKVMYEEQVKKEKSEYGIVTIAMGEGIAKLMEGLGATSVIAGGQTMNPSTEDIVRAIKEVHAKNVIILPNNSNIVMAAEQAAKVSHETVVVVPSKTIPQGLAALLAFNPSRGLDKNTNAMNEAMSTVKSGQVTYAVRDTSIDGIEIKTGDYMGIAEKKIVSAGTDIEAVTKDLFSVLLDDDSEIITLLQGENVTDDETKALICFLEQTYPDVDIEVHQGNQPLYSFIIAVE